MHHKRSLLFAACFPRHVAAFITPNYTGGSSATSARKFISRCATSIRMSDNDFDDFTSNVSFFFPGQGAQYVGMAGKLTDEVPSTKALFDVASDILGYDLLDRCVNGPKNILDSTAVSQPAIFVCSMAAIEKMKKNDGSGNIDNASCAMGLSLGEYSALCFAEALSFEDGAASDAANSSMVSVIGLDSETVKKICVDASERTGRPVAIANYLCSGNYAVSGASEACDMVEKIAKPEYKARMTVRLAVAGAFHTDFMFPAVDTLSSALNTIELKRPRIPVISNVDARPHSDPTVIKSLLVRQVTSPVLFEDSARSLLSRGYQQGFECGPGKVIAGIMKRIEKSAAVVNIEV